jgi:hypothetical protein
MTEATIIPAAFEELRGQGGESFHSFNQGESIPSLFIDAVREGWKSITSAAAIEALQDEIDVEDSLKSLKEARGISLEDFERQLGV